METPTSYNLKDENETNSNIYNFKLYIRKYLQIIIIIIIIIT